MDATFRLGEICPNKYQQGSRTLVYTPGKPVIEHHNSSAQPMQIQTAQRGRFHNSNMPGHSSSRRSFPHQSPLKPKGLAEELSRHQAFPANSCPPNLFHYPPSTTDLAHSKTFGALDPAQYFCSIQGIFSLHPGRKHWEKQTRLCASSLSDCLEDLDNLVHRALNFWITAREIVDAAKQMDKTCPVKSRVGRQ